MTLVLRGRNVILLPPEESLPIMRMHMCIRLERLLESGPRRLAQSDYNISRILMYHLSDQRTENLCLATGAPKSILCDQSSSLRGEAKEDALGQPVNMSACSQRMRQLRPAQQSIHQPPRDHLRAPLRSGLHFVMPPYVRLRRHCKCRRISMNLVRCR